GKVAGLSVMSSHDADPTSGAGPSSYCPLDKLYRGHTSSPAGGVSVQSDRSDVDKPDYPDSSAPTRWYSSAESGSIRKPLTPSADSHTGPSCPSGPWNTGMVPRVS